MTAEADAPPRLRAALDAAAAGPVPPAWDAIRGRVGTGEVATLPPAPARRAARWLPVAAAVALVAGGVALATRAGDDPTPRASDDAAYCAALARPARVGIGVMVFFDVDATTDDVARVRGAIEATGGANDLRYRDRDESYAEALRLFADQPEMLDLLRPEDVPTSFAMTTATDQAAAAVQAAVEDDPAVQAAEVDPPNARDLYAQVVSLAKTGMPNGRPARPLDPAALDALTVAAPTELAVPPELAEQAGPDPVGQVTAWLRPTAGDGRGPQAAASAIVVDAASRCGRDAHEVLGEDADELTTPTTTEPG